jgi:hypothetical protein
MATIEAPTRDFNDQLKRLGLVNAAWYGQVALRNGASESELRLAVEQAVTDVGNDRISTTERAR